VIRPSSSDQDVPATGPGQSVVSTAPVELAGLDSIPLQSPHVIHEVAYPADGTPRTQRLEELGFLPGERVEVLTRGRPGGDPLAIRVGHSTFALRRAEAACVRVRPWPSEAVPA